jgi:septal ring factor EnvC (AmiA/AmiB activator)
VVATKNLEALRRLNERQTKTKDELKTHIWEAKTKVFSIIKDNETLDKEIHAAVKKREAAAASARRERYSRLTERQKSGTSFMRIESLLRGLVSDGVIGGISIQNETEARSKTEGHRKASTSPSVS